jgi:hypothetical protein
LRIYIYSLYFFICGIDASKAFDKVDRDYLWHKELKAMPVRLVKAIKSYYDSSLALVCNNGLKSALFKTNIGVKQDGPLSPKLFAIFIENLITKIELTKMGSSIGSMKIDILLYADDIVLISNSEAELQRMLIEVQEYGQTWEIKFNPSKTMYMAFGLIRIDGRGDTSMKLSLNNTEIIKVNEFKYLGIYITSDFGSKVHVNKKRLAMLISLNKLKKSVLKCSKSVSMKIQIYKTFCRPILYYGTEVLNLTQKQQNDIQTTESNALKDMFGIRRKKHSTLLLKATGLERATDRLILNRLLFYLRLLRNDFTRKVCGTLDESHVKRLRIRSLVDQVAKDVESNSKELETLTSAVCLKVKELKRKYNVTWTADKEKVLEIRQLLERGNRATSELNEILSVNYSNQPTD